MPLNDREQRILAEIEARLRADDPKLVRTVGTASVSSEARRQVRRAAIGFAIGFLLLLLVPLNLWFGLLGFAVMLVSIVHGGNALKRVGTDGNRGLGRQLRGGLSRYLDERPGREGDPRT